MQNFRRKSVLYASLSIIALVAVLFVFNIIADGRFLSVSNIGIIVSHAIYPTFIALGLCFVFACNFTDLSVGSVLVLAAFMTSLLGNRFGFSGVVAGGVVAGMLLIFFNYIIFIGTKVPSWIAGICMAMVYEALAIFLLNNDSTTKLMNAELSRDFSALGQLPTSLIILALGLIAAYILYNRTMIGFNIRAVGSNPEVSKSIGINLIRTLLWVGLISGIFIGIAAFMQESYIARLTVKSGLTSLNLIFQPMAIVLLAQILQKKINIIIAVPICSIIIFAIFNFLTILRVPSGTLQEAVLGGFVIIFGMIGQRNVEGVVK
jgi:ribose/xylose/arabinose/galactoside ABC-type transport system permease subunit